MTEHALSTRYLAIHALFYTDDFLDTSPTSLINNRTAYILTSLDPVT